MRLLVGGVALHVRLRSVRCLLHGQVEASAVHVQQTVLTGTF